MMNIPHLHRHPHAGLRLACGLILGVAIIVGGFGPLNGGDRVDAQGSGACALLTTDEIQPLAPKTSIPAGVAMSLEAAGATSCRYTWGEGVGRFKLDVIVNDAARMLSGKGPDLIKQELNGSVKAGTADAVISDVGEAAAFKADSSAFVHATTYLKGRILQVNLDGYDARDKKDQVVALLKSAASRL